MSGSCRIQLWRVAVGALLVGLVAGIPGPLTHEAKAQGLFDALFGGFSDNPRAQARRVYAPRVYAPRAYAPASYHERHAVPDFSNRAPRSERYSAEGSGGSYCVRLCDGRYFPLPRAANGAQLNSAKVCNALCPAAQTQVLSGHPDDGGASNGTRYADLTNAFVYRDKVVPDCSCTGRGPGGLAQIDVNSDPTLRAGDVVATAAGLAAFKGGSQFPYKTADFTPVESYGKVNSDLRRKLSNLRVDPTATPADPVQTLATAEEPNRAGRPRPRKPRMQATDTSGGWSFYR